MKLDNIMLSKRKQRYSIIEIFYKIFRMGRFSETWLSSDCQKMECLLERRGKWVRREIYTG